MTHASDLFAMPLDMLFDAARKQASNAALEVPLWTGLRLHALPVMGHQANRSDCEPVPAPARSQATLKDIEAALIRKAVDDARGNVQKAARTLGISRATIYRRLGTTLKH